MKSFIFYSILVGILFIFQACHKKTCSKEDTYDGLYNALTCDYQKHITTLKKDISNEEVKESQQSIEYQELLVKHNQQKEEFVDAQKNIQDLEFLISDIKENLNRLDTKQATKPLLKKIRYQIITMQKKIKLNIPKFKQSDIRYAKKILKSKKLTKRLKQSIKEIIASEKVNHLNKESKKRLFLALQETKRYTTSLK